MSINLEGFDDLQRKLRDLGKRAEELDGEHSVSLDELFPPTFIQKYTEFSNVDEMFEASGFTIESQDDFDAIPDEDLDAFISETTRFSNWEEMLNTAAEEWTVGKMGL